MSYNRKNLAQKQHKHSEKESFEQEDDKRDQRHKYKRDEILEKS